MITARILIALLSALPSATADSSADSAKAELSRLQGDWRLVRSVREGREVPQERLKQMTIHTIRGDRWIPGRDPNDFTTIVLDPTAEPKAIDLKDRDGNMMLGIYRHEGMTLTLCVARLGVERPTKFASPEGSKTFLIELRRPSP